MVKIAVVSYLAVAEAGKLAVTWSDCGAKHAKVTDLQPTSVTTGKTEALVGSGTVDEDVTKAKFTATIKAAGATLATCSGDGTTDIECKLPLGAGVVTVKALTFPIQKGAVKIPVTVKTSSFLPPSLAKVDVHIAATDQNGEDVVCLDVHTTKAMDLEEVEAETESDDVEVTQSVGEFMASWAQAQEGQHIDRGECWDLANEAIKHAKAAGFKVLSSPSTYEWSSKTVSYQTAQPGDILQFVSYSEQTGHSSKSTGSHHTAVVIKSFDSSSCGIEVEEQNPKPVHDSVYHPCSKTGGSMTVYRMSSSSPSPTPSPTPSPSPSGCGDNPTNWQSSESESCSYYESHNYCTSSGGEGSGWKSSWGPISNYADSQGRSATDACCGCGGGSRGFVV